MSYGAWVVGTRGNESRGKNVSTGEGWKRGKKEKERDDCDLTRPFIRFVQINMNGGRALIANI